ncbi:MAG TPA: hypothetical protein VMW53_07285 [archaeon]|nr:hypothetical protein [archaeon]
MKAIRVFPRKTNQTPDDRDAYVGDPTLFVKADKILVSCTFTWDKPEAERLAKAWKWIAPVELGGPAYGNVMGEFIPGRFLRKGNTITSRGCPNKCWFCYVWKRCKGKFEELEIKDGWNVQDDNLLACSEKHIRAVFQMLKRQPKKAIFSGGLQAYLLEDWHVELLVDLKPQRIYFAYDTPDDYESLAHVSKLLIEVHLLPSHNVCCYNLIGFPGDTISKAEKRLTDTLNLGFMPFAMLWRDDEGKTNQEWKKFQRLWTRPEIIYARSNYEHI